MNIDFTQLFSFLLLACCVTLLVQRLHPLRPRAWNSWVEFSRLIFPVLLVVVVLRAFIVEPFRIPSESMMPTLQAGDFILVSKFSYGLRLPLAHYRLTRGSLPRRGDVTVFRHPANPSVTYIKRIVGLPGDRVRYLRGTLYVNDRMVPLHDRGVFRDAPERSKAHGFQLFRESLGDTGHSILRDPALRRLLSAGEWAVPPGQYFVLGDNRDHSNDSRYWGFVPDSNLVGKAFIIWMNWKSWHRIGVRL